MRTLTALGIVLLFHTRAPAQTLGELSAAHGVGASVGAAEASSGSTARAARDTISSHLGSAPSDGSVKSAWADHSHGATATAKGWASPRTSGTASGKAGSWVAASSAGPGSAGNAKGWVTAGSSSPARR